MENRIEELGMTDEEIRAINRYRSCGWTIPETRKYVFEGMARIPVKDLSEFQLSEWILDENDAFKSGETIPLAALQKSRGIKTLELQSLEVSQERQTKSYQTEIAVATKSLYYHSTC